MVIFALTLTHSLPDIMRLDVLKQVGYEMCPVADIL